MNEPGKFYEVRGRVPTCLDLAAEAVDTSRPKDYGHPRENFAAIARLWSAYLAKANVVTLDNPTQPITITPEHVGIMMILLKIGRTVAGRLTTDTLVDIAGYARCLERLGEAPESTKPDHPFRPWEGHVVCFDCKNVHN